MGHWWKLGCHSWMKICGMYLNVAVKAVLHVHCRVNEKSTLFHLFYHQYLRRLEGVDLRSTSGTGSTTVVNSAYLLVYWFICFNLSISTSMG